MHFVLLRKSPPGTERTCSNVAMFTVICRFHSTLGEHIQALFIF